MEEILRIYLEQNAKSNKKLLRDQTQGKTRFGPAGIQAKIAYWFGPRYFKAKTEVVWGY